MVINEEKLIFIYKGYGVRCPNKYYELDDKSIVIRATNIRGDIKY